MIGVTINDALDVARALKRAPVAGGGCARLYDEAGGTCLVVSWAPADDQACIVVPGTAPDGGDSHLTVPGSQI